VSDPDLRDCGGKTGYNLFNRNFELSPTRIDLYLAVGIRGPQDGKFIAQFTAADGRSLAREHERDERRGQEKAAGGNTRGHLEK
jgi:hypothetical protein